MSLMWLNHPLLSNPDQNEDILGLSAAVKQAKSRMTVTRQLPPSHTPSKGHMTIT